MTFEDNRLFHFDVIRNVASFQQPLRYPYYLSIGVLFQQALALGSRLVAFAISGCHIRGTTPRHFQDGLSNPSPVGSGSRIFVLTSVSDRDDESDSSEMEKLTFSIDY